MQNNSPTHHNDLCEFQAIGLLRSIKLIHEISHVNMNALTMIVSRESSDGIAESALIELYDECQVDFLFTNRLSSTDGLCLSLHNVRYYRQLRGL